MATPPNIRRIRTEDFDPEYRKLLERLSYSINEFQDQTIFVLSKRVDFQNLNQYVIDVDFRIDGSGNITQPAIINTEGNINGRTIGVYCINATNLQNPNTIPTSQPFVQFTIDTNQVRILNVSSLQADSQYRLKLLLIGENT